MFGLFGRKKEVEDLRNDVQESFNHVKRDFNKVGEWIKHLDEKHSTQEGEVERIKDQLLDLQNDLIEIKDFISFFGPQMSGNASKQAKTITNKQTTPSYVQTIDQTPVQTDILENLTQMERGIVWALLNSEMNLSYEDLAAVLGKEKSTVRGQINSIKQKAPGLIDELMEQNGKKRLYIPEKKKAEVVKSVKVRVKKGKKR